MAILRLVHMCISTTAKVLKVWKGTDVPAIPHIIESIPRSEPTSLSYPKLRPRDQETTILSNNHAQSLLSIIQSQKQPRDPTTPHIQRPRQQQSLPSPQSQEPTPSPLRRIQRLDLAHLVATPPPANLHIQPLLALRYHNPKHPRAADQDEAKLGRHAVWQRCEDGWRDAEVAAR
jgi:hypothetical protein